MIICKACGQHNADEEDFCTFCGRYLEWSGEHVDDVTEEPVAEEEEPAPEPVPAKGFWNRVRGWFGFPQKMVLPPSKETEAEQDEGAAPAAASAEGEAPTEEASSTEPDPGGQPPDTAVVPAIGVGGGGASDAAQGVVVTSSAPAANEAPSELSATPPAGIPATAPAEIAAAAAAGAAASSLTLRRPGELASPPASPPVARNGSPPLVGDVALDSPARAERSVVLRRPGDAPAVSERTRRRPLTGGGASDLQTTPSPGDIYCPTCGQFNNPSKVYCRRCGTPLPRADDDVVPQYEPIDFVHRHWGRDTKLVPAGARPGKWGRHTRGGFGSERYMRVLARVGMFIIAAGLLLSLVGPIAPQLRNWFNNRWLSLVNHVEVTYTQQFAIGADATSSWPGHPAGLAVDDGNNTFWLSLPNRTTHGAGQSITAVFSGPTGISYVGVLSGASGSQGPSEQNYLKWSRPQDIVLTFSPGNLKVSERLKDTSNFQRLNIHGISNATSVTLHVLTVYPGDTGNSVAITEIEFFQRS
jgi:hypothetical protein